MAAVEEARILTPGQCRAARAFLEISQEELARAALVETSSIRKLESGQAVQVDASQAIRSALELLGLAFVNGYGVEAVALNTSPYDDSEVH